MTDHRNKEEKSRAKSSIEFSPSSTQPILHSKLDVGEETLHAEQLQNAEAETKATEERTRWKLVLAYAASVVAIVSLIGLGWAWMERTRFTRELELAEQKREAEFEFKASLQETERLANLAEKSSEITRKLGDARIRLLEVCLEKGDDKNASSILDDIIQQESSEQLAVIGSYFVDKGHVKEGRRLLENAAKLSPNHADLHYELGLAYYKENKLELAADEYEKAIGLDEDFVDALVNAGSTNLNLGRLDKAKSQLEKAIGLNPKDATALSNYAEFLARTNQKTEAIHYFEISLREAPDAYHANQNFGILLMNSGDAERAIGHFRKAIKANPAIPESHCDLGHALNQCGHFAEAVEAFELGHKLGTKRPGWSLPSAQWLDTNRMLAGLEPVLEEVLAGKRKPSSPKQATRLASMCLRKRLHEGAVSLFEFAFMADADFAQDMQSAYRFFAASSAVSAAVEFRANGEPKKSREFLNKAHDWLSADLKVIKDSSFFDQYSRIAIAELRRRLDATALAPVRDPELLSELPEEIQEKWRALWREMSDVLEDLEG